MHLTSTLDGLTSPRMLATRGTMICNPLIKQLQPHGSKVGDNGERGFVFTQIHDMVNS